jgi:hypothetical protein
MPQRRLRLAQEQVRHRFVLEKNQKKSLTGAKKSANLFAVKRETD